VTETRLLAKEFNFIFNADGTALLATTTKWTIRICPTSTGDRNADKILRALRYAPKGMTKTEISAEVFNRHASSAEIDEALRLLNGLKIVRFQLEANNGPRFNTGFPPL
jgi:hypothetical protein